jgi:hypothetical protein
VTPISSANSHGIDFCANNDDALNAIPLDT